MISTSTGKLIIVLLFTFVNLAALAQNGSVKGVIRTSDGQPAPYVNVALKENIKAGNYTLITTFVGFQPQEKQVEVTAGEATVVDFTLSESAEQLAEIVVSDTRSMNEKTVEIGKAGIKPMDLPQSIIVIDKTV